MRLDRFLTLTISGPLHARSSARRCLPILMYHSISDDPESGVHPYFKVCTSPSRFADHMQWLADGGWKGVTLAEGLAALRAPDRQTQSPRPVAITFDDGFRDFHTAAFGSLRRHGFSATMYLPTAFIGEQRLTFKDRECLTWPEVLELHAAGIEFGSHTVNHPRLVQLQWPEIESELRDSKSVLEQRLGRRVDSFAYPYGFPSAEGEFSRRLRGILSDAGYTNNVTTIIERARPTDDVFLLPRLPANSEDDRVFFEAKLAGAYDWMAGPQSLTKQVARWVRPKSRPATSRRAH